MQLRKKRTPFKVIIAGSRTFSDYEYLKQKCDRLLSEQEGAVEVVCGGARGADLLGKQYAEERGYQVTMFPADWEKYGNRAGFVRNLEMGGYADALIAFWDGISRGTKHMIECAEDEQLAIRVIRY